MWGEVSELGDDFSVEVMKFFKFILEENIQQNKGNRNYLYGGGAYDESTVQMLYFEYKTKYMKNNKQ